MAGFDFGSLMSNVGGLDALFNSIFGGIKGDQQAKWTQGLATQVLNTLMQNMGAGQDYFNTYAGAVGPQASQNINNLMAQMWGDGNGFLPQLQNTLNFNNSRINDLFGGNQQFQTPTTNAAQQNILGMFGGAQGTQGLAGQVFGGGGWTPQYQQALDQLSSTFGNVDIGNRGQLAGDVASEFLNNRGNTQLSSLLQQYAQGVLGAGGFTPTLNAAGPAITNLLNSNGNTSGQDALRSAASGAMGNNGLTQTGSMGEAAALQNILNNGQTPTSQALQHQGLNLVGRNNILDPMQASLFAGNDAMQTYKGQMENLYDKALSRGGGPGANVASGMQNGAAGDFADEALAARSKAVIDALMKQQGLNLQQTQTGADMATQGLGQETQRMNSSNNLLTNLEDVASRRFGTGGSLLSSAEQLNNSRLLGGLNFIPELQGAATQNIATTGGLGLGGGQLATSNVNSANNLITQLAQLGLGASNGINNVMGNMNQYALGAGNLFNNMNNVGGSLMSSLFGNEISGGNLALGQNTGWSNAMNSGANNSLGLGQLYGNMFSNGFNPLNNLVNQSSNSWQQALQGMPSLVGAMGRAWGQNNWNGNGGR